MKLKPLFDAQKVLMERIEKEHPPVDGEDRFNKRILSLLVEVGECANEWRGFKFWSKDQKPRIKGVCDMCNGDMWSNIECPKCEGTGMDESKNPLLEEYVDGLHFVLELGISSRINTDLYSNVFEYPEGSNDVNQAFLRVFEEIQFFSDIRTYSDLLVSYIRLGAALGFTWEEIEQAYFSKNAVNHQRQLEGY